MYSKYQDRPFQKQLIKQDLLQLQHQRNVCEILFTTVASEKKLALGMSKKKNIAAMIQ